MKQWITLIAATAIFTSCSKDNLQQEAEQQQLLPGTSASRTAEAGVTVSSWEQAAWSRQDSADMAVFSSYRSMPQYTAEVATGGVLITFAKIISAPAGYETYKEPQRLDFAFVPVEGRSVKGAYLMADAPATESVTITYRIPAASASETGPDAHLYPTNFRVQYVVLPGEFLAQNGLTPQSVSGYSYAQIMDLISPK